MLYAMSVTQNMITGHITLSFDTKPEGADAAAMTAHMKDLGFEWDFKTRVWKSALHLVEVLDDRCASAAL